MKWCYDCFLLSFILFNILSNASLFSLLEEKLYFYVNCKYIGKRSFHFAAKLMSFNSWIVCSLTKSGGYCFKASGVANFPNGFITTSSLKCENKVEDTLQGIFPYFIAFSFCSWTFSVNITSWYPQLMYPPVTY